MSDRAPVPLAHAGGQVLVGANGSGSPSSSSSTTTGWTIVGHARGNGAGPFAVLEALENLGAAQIQSGIAGEGDALANGVIELDGRHPAADDGARIGASLHALGQAPRPAPIVLAGNDRLALHHVLRVAIELDHIAGTIRSRALGVTILRRSGIVALQKKDNGCQEVNSKKVECLLHTCTSTQVGSGADHSPVGLQMASDGPRSP